MCTHPEVLGTDLSRWRSLSVRGGGLIADEELIAGVALIALEGLIAREDLDPVELL